MRSLDDNPEYQLARAEYLYPDADTADGKYQLRIEAATRMHAIETEAEAERHRLT